MDTPPSSVTANLPTTLVGVGARPTLPSVRVAWLLLIAVEICLYALVPFKAGCALLAVFVGVE